MISNLWLQEQETCRLLQKWRFELEVEMKNLLESNKKAKWELHHDQKRLRLFIPEFFFQIIFTMEKRLFSNNSRKTVVTRVKGSKHVLTPNFNS